MAALCRKRSRGLGAGRRVTHTRLRCPVFAPGQRPALPGQGRRRLPRPLSRLALASIPALWALTPALAWASAGESVQGPLVYQAWQTFTTSDGLPDDGIRALYVDGERLWVGTDNGLAMFEDGTWRSWGEDDGLPWRVISAIDAHPESGAVWLGTWGGGLVRFSAGRFDPFTQFNSGLAGDLVFAVTVENDRVWAATNGGLSVLDTVRGTWGLHLERRTDAPETVAVSLGFDASRTRLLGAAWCGGVHIYDLIHESWSVAAGQSTDMASGRDEPRPFSGTSLCIAATDRSLWWATRTGVSRSYMSGAWEPRRVSVQGLGDFQVNCLAARSETEAWLGGTRGVAVLADWEEDTWVTYQRCDEGPVGVTTVARDGSIMDRRPADSTIAANWVRSIAFQGDDVWIGTSNGLSRGIGRTRRPDQAGGTRPGSLLTPVTCRVEDDLPLVVRDTAGDPEDLKAVKVAVHGPITKTITLPGAERQQGIGSLGPDSLAVQLAVERANKLGGYRGKAPFEVVIGTHGYPRYGWGTLEDDLARFASHPVLGILARFGPDNRTATAVALRTEVPMVNVADHSPTLDERGCPWVFRCRVDDPIVLQRLLEYIVRDLGLTHFAVVRAPGALEKEHLDQWAFLARELAAARPAKKRGDDSDPEAPQTPARLANGSCLVADETYDPQTDDLAAVLKRVGDSGAEVVLTWADANWSARFVRRMRGAGLSQLFVGSDRIVCDEFLALAGRSPGLTLAPEPCPHRRDRDAMAHFVERYKVQTSSARLERLPDVEAHRAYHATRHLLQAINLGGLDRHAVRRTLQRMSVARVARLEGREWRSIALPPW